MSNLRLSSIVPKSLRVGDQSTKRIITDFIDATGLVYFGYVSQRDDDHHIVRGMTVSTKHHDDHYCIGTYEDYDVVFVERSDTLQNGKRHRWHIMEFDLKTSVDIPHSFIGSGKHGNGFHELLTIKYPNLQPASLGALLPYPNDFLAAFNVYTTPAHIVDFEQVIDPDTASFIAKHFAGLVMEITEQALYVYSEKPHLTTELLVTMATNGAWLAARIDKNSRSLVG